MPNSINIQLQDPEHLLVEIGDESRIGNLYYLGLDALNGEYDLKPTVGLQQLIATWIEVVVQAPNDRLFYLPFDFSDEFTKWIACQKNQSSIDCVFGWAPVEGWSFSPTDFREFLVDLRDFQPDDPVNPQSIYQPRFLSGLRQSQAILPRK